MKVFVIGNQEAVLGFSLVGVHGKAVSSESEVNAALDEALSNANNGIVLVTEDVAGLIQTRMEQLKLRSTVPLVVEIPGPKGVATDKPSLNEIVMKAIGVKL
jgi:V/A-type H+/Na+-transporting ATPase subunit F